MSRTIAIGLAPNYQQDDVVASLRWLLEPARWVAGTAVADLEQAFARHLPSPSAIAFGSGRAALAACLAAGGVGEGDEVLLPAFTCVAVPNAVRALGAVPVYVDIDSGTYTIDPQAMMSGRTRKTRAIIVQHTFGYPADLDAIVAWARQQRVFVVEDCAHALGSRYAGRSVGTYGDAAIFSFGRDKPLGPVFGGVAVAPDAALAEAVRRYRSQYMVSPPAGWVARQLLHAPITTAALAGYRWGPLGPGLVALAKATGLLSPAVTAGERHGQPPAVARYGMANALAALAKLQLAKAETYARHRRLIAAVYRQRLEGHACQLPPPDNGRCQTAWLRLPVQVKNPRRVMATAKARGIYLGDWYRPVIAPAGVNFATVGYRPGSCPRAEAASAGVINLPTHVRVTAEAAARVVDAVIAAL